MLTCQRKTGVLIVIECDPRFELPPTRRVMAILALVQVRDNSFPMITAVTSITGCRRIKIAIADTTGPLRAVTFPARCTRVSARQRPAG